MKNYVIILLSILALSSCSDKQKEFSSIEKGMTKEQVVLQVGEPTSKRDILVAEIWKYDLADRTVVFRNGEVYDIITSTEARVDSIESTLKETGRDVKEKLRATGDTLDSTSKRLKEKIIGDSVRKN
jgi:outer membrane protein assembly factor BamE (lipoprotein component of BamABCDE complex)